MKRIQKPSINQGKNIRIEEYQSTNTDNQSPIFCLEYIQKGYYISNCTKDEQVAFLDSLFSRRNLPWTDLKGMHRHKLGPEKIARNAIKAPIPPLILIKPDTTFLAFRFDGLKAMVGFRVGRLFYVLWLDQQFKLYRH
jgi:hypothetical protein